MFLSALRPTRAYGAMSNAPLQRTQKPREKRASALKSGASRKTAGERTPPVADAAESRYAIGDHISQPMFGYGTVRDIKGNILTIDFSKSVTKQILEDYVKSRNQ